MRALSNVYIAHNKGFTVLVSNSSAVWFPNVYEVATAILNSKDEHNDETAATLVIERFRAGETVYLPNPHEHDIFNFANELLRMLTN